MKDETAERILSLTENQDFDYGICSPPMDAQVALNELTRFLLGDDFYVVMPMSPKQVNTEIVYTIERLYENSWIRKKMQPKKKKVKNNICHP
jgi:hypothetical protein